MGSVNPNSEFLPATSYAVLGLLSFGQELSGYDLRQWALRSLRHFYWSPAQSQIYRELRRLAELSLVTSRAVAQDGRPDKVLYRITDRGLEELRRWVEESPVGEPVVKHPAALRLFFGHVSSSERVAEILREHLAGLERALDELEELRMGLDDDPTSDLAVLALDVASAMHRADWDVVRSAVAD